MVLCCDCLLFTKNAETLECVLTLAHTLVEPCVGETNTDHRILGL